MVISRYAVFFWADKSLTHPETVAPVLVSIRPSIPAAFRLYPARRTLITSKLATPNVAATQPKADFFYASTPVVDGAHHDTTFKP